MCKRYEQNMNEFHTQTWALSPRYLNMNCTFSKSEEGGRGGGAEEGREGGGGERERRRKGEEESQTNP